jgi:integrase
VYVKQLPSGAWRTIAQYNGKRASGTAPTRTAAKILYARLMLELGGTPDIAGLTVGELLELHLTEHDYRPTTLADLQRVRARLPTTFLEREITTVTPVVIDHLYRTLDMTPHRVRKVHELLGAAFKRARRRGWVHTVPTRDAELPRIDEREDTTPELDDVRRLIAAADPEFALFVLLACVTGARRGELCALRWDDIDADKQAIRIRRAASYTPASGLVVGDVKTGSKGRRTIPIDEITTAETERHRLAQRTAALAAGVACQWVFTEDYASPWRPDLATHRFVRLRDSLGLHDVRLHDLRHFVASELVGEITDPRTASEHLGHARTSMTLDRYAKSTNARRRTASDTLQARLRG